MLFLKVIVPASYAIKIVFSNKYVDNYALHIIFLKYLRYLLGIMFCSAEHANDTSIRIYNSTDT